MNQWIETHKTTDEDAGLEIVTEALELPHGCLVRTTAIQGNASRFFKRPATIATDMVFVAGLILERQADTSAHPLRNSLAPAELRFGFKH